MSTVSENITGGLLSRLQQDPKAKTILKKIREGDGDYTDAEKYALRAGELLSEVFKANISAGNFPVGSVDEIASLIVPALELNHKAVSQVAGMVQKTLNHDGNIGMNAILPQFDRSGAYNLVGRMAKYDTFEDAEFLLDEPVKTAALNVTDETLRRNADFQYKSGFKPKIVRTAESDACDWCKELEGEYDYEEVKDRNNPVYQRHNNCACEITYEPGDGRVQDVYSKQQFEDKAAYRQYIQGTKENIRKTNSEQKKSINMNVARSGDNVGSSIKTPQQRVIEAAIKTADEKILIETIFENHDGLKGNSPAGWKNILENAGYVTKPLNKGTYKGVKFEEGGGYRVVLSYDGGYFQYHPEGGKYHVGAYYKISSGKTDTVRYNLDGSIRND